MKQHTPEALWVLPHEVPGKEAAMRPSDDRSTLLVSEACWQGKQCTNSNSAVLGQGTDFATHCSETADEFDLSQLVHPEDRCRCRRSIRACAAAQAHNTVSIT